jgi:hypothetical protein
MLAPTLVFVGGAELVDGRPAGARRDEHLTQTMAAETAVKLGS